MTKELKLIVSVILGTAGGLLAFSGIDLLFSAGIRQYLLQSLLQGAIVGFSFGTMLGLSHMVLYREFSVGIKKALISGLVGSAAGIVGMVLAAETFLFIINRIALDLEKSYSLLLPLCRGCAWMVLGLLIGVIDGILKRSWVRIAAGGTGGMIGGLLGGVALEYFAASQGSLPRMIGFCITGAMIGLFLGEFERRFSFARLRILTGTRKNREFLLADRITTLGDKSGKGIAILGYRNLLPMKIIKKKEEIVLHIEKGKELVVNDRKVNERHSLKYQDVIQTGTLKMLYLPVK